jgi:hypothetical protein
LLIDDGELPYLYHIPFESLVPSHPTHLARSKPFAYAHSGL